MKVIILAGGLGTRISEETKSKPKPMVTIGDKPIIWHIIQIYASQGFNDFIIAGGYKQEVIREWVRQSYLSKEEWISELRIEVIDTGEESLTGPRISACIEFIEDPEVLCTYGDGVANVDIAKLLTFHRMNKKLATLTTVRPPARFGHVSLNGDKVESFDEKNQADEGWINGGFFVLDSGILPFFNDENEAFEKGVLPRLAAAGELMAYKHAGFWRPMDTLRDREELTELTLKEEVLPWMSL
jgi:glucose-1-phosphate cytidylyltransferase